MTADQCREGSALPPRAGPRPRTTPCTPHSQVDQIPAERLVLSRWLLGELSVLDDVELGGSRRAPPGTIGIHLRAGCRRADERRFLLGREFAHIHVEDDGSLHAILPEPLRTEAIDAGWAEPHPLAGAPTVSADTVMIYAPRDATEVGVVADLVRRSWENAHA